MNEKPWAVNFHRDLEKEIRRLPRSYLKRVLEAIEALGADPRPHGSKRLEGYDLWRIQIGVYRVLYEIDEENRVVNTYRIGHRKDVYRSL